ncbi:MAG: thioredoxin domain-containing protein [Desulfitobacteriaceae bacterium]|nr:thioredoxin domain-containing protein [Desulfitobacteriaceae bacterium]MDD4401947.1 thioredoxin domain-containing protein [Desulfitobacteriaceae bacterium]
MKVIKNTCHWCHVMEKESFEDREAANLLNLNFISIKVDREERPDIDHLYMSFCQALTGSGGWPLTILMTPDKKPFFAGTYFPKTRRYGLTGLMEILHRAATLWQTDENSLRESADDILRYLREKEQNQLSEETNEPVSAPGNIVQPHMNLDAPQLPEDWIEKVIDQAYTTFVQIHDWKYGGFGNAPKFPTPHNLGFLLRYAEDHPDSLAYPMVRKTLDSMSEGGIYDHIGFGFSRYSTDSMWLVPHFEKMLYDNALLAYTYLESFQSKLEEADSQKARGIFTYVLRDMTSPEGAFYCAEDADSEGTEGKFYVWSPAEIREVLGPKQGNLYCAAYNITPEGNFEGKSIPNLIKTNWDKLAHDYNLTRAQLETVLEASRQTLFNVREKRIHPHKDDKVLTSWNGLMIASLAKGAQVLNEPVYLQAAERALKFINTKLRREDGRLLARYRDGESANLGYLDDYAYLIWGLLELYTAGGKFVYLEEAVELQENLERLFADTLNGGYFLTGSDAEELLIRPKESYDGALPSGNSIIALNLLRLARMTREKEWEARAQKQLTAFKSIISAHPSGYTAFLQALQLARHPGQELILSGPLSAPEMPDMSKTIFSRFLPYSSLIYQEGKIGQFLPWVNDYPLEEIVTAYVCQNFSCQNPVKTPVELDRLLHQA